MLEQELRRRITASKIGSTERDVLRVVLGECQQKSFSGKISDDIVVGVIRKLLKSNQETIGYLKENDNRRSDYLEEIEVLNSLLPAFWSETEIKSKIISEGLFEKVKMARSNGEAVGLVMGQFKKTNAPVEGNTVKKVIEQLRAE